jgi:hypothetical protein
MTRAVEEIVARTRWRRCDCSYPATDNIPAHEHWYLSHLELDEDGVASQFRHLADCATDHSQPGKWVWNISVVIEMQYENTSRFRKRVFDRQLCDSKEEAQSAAVAYLRKIGVPAESLPLVGEC